MITLGLRRLEDYRPAPPDGPLARLRDHLNRDRVSYRLLHVSMPPSPAEVELFEHIMRNLRLGSGVYRTTFRGRFHDFDRAIAPHLLDRFGSAAALRVEDWAASDCLTSAEWADPVFATFPNARLSASDLTLFLVEARLASGDAFILERDGAPLQYLRDPFVVTLNPPEPRSLPLNWLLARRALEKLQSQGSAWKLPEEWLDSPSCELAMGGVVFRKISVIHPEAALLAHRDPRFSVKRHSAFHSLAAPVDVVRTMNIFNRAYFDAGRLAEGALAVWRSLRPGGVWIAGRTFQERPPAHDATLFERTAAGFSAFHRVGKGSEIEPLAIEQRWTA